MLLLSVRESVNRTHQTSSHVNRPNIQNFSKPLVTSRKQTRNATKIRVWPNKMQQNLVRELYHFDLPTDIVDNDELIHVIESKIKEVQDLIRESKASKMDIINDVKKTNRKATIDEIYADPRVIIEKERIESFEYEIAKLKYMTRLAKARKHEQDPDKKSKIFHHIRDLYYGEGSRAWRSKAFEMHVEDYENDPQLIDIANKDSGITRNIINSEDNNIIEKHLIFINILKGEVTVDNLEDKKDKEFLKSIEEAQKIKANNPEDLTTNQKWLLFVKENVDKLTLEEDIHSMDTASEDYDAKKDQFYRNTDYSTIEGEDEKLRNMILETYRNHGKIDPEMKVTSAFKFWIATAMFRKTSKLGIDFAMNEGAVVHFNLHLFGGNLVDSIGKHPNLKEPITVDELRHLQGYLDEYGEHDQVDFFIFPNPDGGLELVKRERGLGLLNEEQMEWRGPEHIEKKVDKEATYKKPPTPSRK